MAGGLRGNEPRGDTNAIQAQAGKNAPLDSLLTFRIEQEPLLLSNVATILRDVTWLHAKLWWFDQQPEGDMVYLADDPMTMQKANLTAVSITQNSPLTVVVMVSEAFGKALASLIDAVSQTHIRYSQAKLELEQTKVEIGLKHAQLQQQLDEHEMAMHKRAVELHSQLEELKVRELARREAESKLEMDIMTRSVEVAWLVISGLYPRAPQERKEVMARIVANHLVRLSNSEGLEVESLKPRKSA